MKNTNKRHTTIKKIIPKKKNLMKKLNEGKELRKKYTNKLNVDDVLVKKISLIFKSKT